MNTEGKWQIEKIAIKLHALRMLDVENQLRRGEFSGNAGRDTLAWLLECESVMHGGKPLGVLLRKIKREVEKLEWQPRK